MSWSRKELKSRAKQVLRTSYWKAFLVSLLLALVSGGIGGCSGNWNTNSSNHFSGMHMGLGDSNFGDISGGVGVAILLFIILFAIVAGLCVIAFNIFVITPFKVNAHQYFKQASQGEVELNYFLYAFRSGKYLGIVAAMFWAGLLNFLWFLLFIIPGIVKTYAYRMVPYILGDNPTIGRKRAVQLSNQMTKGHKWRMFVLDLSFIGWYLLGIIALGIGVLFVLPYYNTTRAELYLALRQQVIKEGLATPEELNLVYIG
ncbi:hypothetical protein A8709_28260 [Paenibacillus pectinilyticus]|uniref:DUF975 domain-containing protein n=1 Tax=Paenibacillus pectinilyticus TaxID=512399 RepID=A0A1C0ZUP2_9BACL|nr:DUF975 family protein [Paenibacillus pectinilyticus]OCT11768.1 hypothetical protein A8709_28260 [Paenibacillus pectinilyticus]